MLPPPVSPVAVTTVLLRSSISSPSNVTSPPWPRRLPALSVLPLMKVRLGPVGASGRGSGALGASCSPGLLAAASSAVLLSDAAMGSAVLKPCSCNCPPACSPETSSCTSCRLTCRAAMSMRPPVPCSLLASSWPCSCRWAARKTTSPPACIAPSDVTTTRPVSFCSSSSPLVSATWPPAPCIPRASIGPSFVSALLASTSMRPPSSPLARMLPVLVKAVAAIWMLPPLLRS